MELNINTQTDDNATLFHVGTMLFNLAAARRTASPLTSQPEVDNNTGTDEAGLSHLSPSVVSVDVGAVDDSAAPVPVPVKEATRRKKSVQAPAVAEDPKPVVHGDAPTAEGSSSLITEVATSLTVDDVRAALQAYTLTKGVPAGIELLKSFGASRITELAAENYSAFVAQCAA